MHDYTLIRSARRTLALYIRDDGLEVRAPLRMPKRDIDSFVASKHKWITDALARKREQSDRRKAFGPAYGDTVVYRGKQYPISAKDGNRVGFADERFYMPPDMPPEDVKYACVMIYRILAKRDLTKRVIHFAERMNVAPTAVKINGATTRWGSCSAKRSLNFSWRLIMADDDVVDYVVVHELAHITEMNHSARFWAIVEGVFPDYRARRARLKELQHRLNGENWEYWSNLQIMMYR
jgi:predicted metal-dependent hydrolase